MVLTVTLKNIHHSLNITCIIINLLLPLMLSTWVLLWTPHCPLINIQIPRVRKLILHSRAKTNHSNSSVFVRILYRISRKFDMELNLAVGDFLWKSPNSIHHLQIHWCFIIQCDPWTAKLISKSDLLLIPPNIFPARFSAYTVWINWKPSKNVQLGLLCVISAEHLVYQESFKIYNGNYKSSTWVTYIDVV